MYNFIRVGAAIPKLKVADCIYNTEEIMNLISQASQSDVKVLTFPELCITSYSCADLFMQKTLLDSAEKSLGIILEHSKQFDMFISVGLPVILDNQCFNCSASIYKGQLLGLVPKTYLPNYSEFYEKRWFTSTEDLISSEVTLCGQTVPIGSNLVFIAKNIPYLAIGIEICEDLWSPIPPSSYLSLFGASLILNLSASNELVAKNEYRTQLVSQQSARCMSAYVYCSAGIGESTQDVVFSGHSLICENGSILKQSKRFSRENELIYSDIDLEALSSDRKKNTSFMNHVKTLDIDSIKRIYFSIGHCDIKQLEREINTKPFIPKSDQNLNSRCNDIFNIQLTGLAKRIEHTGAKSVIVGISGGLDSTLALLVAVKAFDFLNMDRKNIIGVTMPGFGTTDRTYYNAIHLMESLSVSIREISIKEASLQHFKDIDHDPSVHDVTYENTQARERTQILMDISNKESGFVVGTGDLSELALGWATYNGDHMSMYGVNAGVPKTLVKVLVNWIATSGTLDEISNKILLDILDTPVSPELLPPSANGTISQKTEELVGPYELHDFFLYYVIRYGFSPAKIYYLAKTAFNGSYKNEILLKWLKNFYKRFFTQQFKRSCLPDGPKVGTVSLSPRGDWRMPSDASYRIWIDEIENIVD